jgi:hypothetical protein
MGQGRVELSGIPLAARQIMEKTLRAQRMANSQYGFSAC